MLDHKAFGVDPNELARKLVNGLVARDSKFQAFHTKALIQRSIGICIRRSQIRAFADDRAEVALAESSTLNESELAYLVSVASETILQQGLQS